MKKGRSGRRLRLRPQTKSASRRHGKAMRTYGPNRRRSLLEGRPTARRDAKPAAVRVRGTILQPGPVRIRKDQQIPDDRTPLLLMSYIGG